MNYRILTSLVTLNLLFAGCVSTEDNLFDGNEIASNKSFTPFTLVDSNNSTFNSTSLDGMVIVVNFFYTNCPDVCSTVTAELKTLYQEYESEIERKIYRACQKRENSDTYLILSEDSNRYLLSKLAKNSHPSPQSYGEPTE